MADGVFGTPIDAETLKGMPEYKGKTIRRADMAKVARDLMNAGGKDTNCVKYVENLRDEYGNGVKVLCTIYNATGGDLTYSQSKDFHGHIYNKPYPLVIKNGQWGGYLHVHTTASATGSSAAVVYSGVNNDEVKCDWMLSWSDPWSGSNTVYTEIREGGHYKDTLGDIQDKVENGNDTSNDEWTGCTSTTTIATGTTTSFVGIMSLTPPVS
ncbi:hypothetical protein LguiB_026615 [Lonicera macranthoides]